MRDDSIFSTYNNNTQSKYRHGNRPRFGGKRGKGLADEKETKSSRGPRPMMSTPPFGEVVDALDQNPRERKHQTNGCHQFQTAPLAREARVVGDGTGSRARG